MMESSNVSWLITSTPIVNVCYGFPDACVWIPHYNTSLGMKIGNFYGILVALYSIGTTLVLNKPVFDGERGQVRIFTRHGEGGRMEGREGLWSELGEAIFGIEGSELFGISAVLSFDGKAVEVRGDSHNSKRGFFRIYGYNGV